MAYSTSTTDSEAGHPPLSRGSATDQAPQRKATHHWCGRLHGGERWLLGEAAVDDEEEEVEGWECEGAKHE